MSVARSAEATSPPAVARVSAARVAKPNGWWGMMVLIATEATLFGVLIASFFYLRFKTAQWPPAGVADPKPTVPLILMGVLLATSLPMQLASSSARRGRLGSTRLGLGLALFVGTGYVAMQIDRLIVSLRTLKPQESAYASMVYVISGGHTAHVALALAFNAFLLLRLVRGLTNYRAIGVRGVATYWHFVNLLALAVTGALLSPAV